MTPEKTLGVMKLVAFLCLGLIEFWSSDILADAQVQSKSWSYATYKSLPAQPSSSDKAQEQTLRFNAGSEPETLDPALITGSTEMLLASALFEGLLNYHPEDLSPTPGLAHRWKTSSDGTILIFELRKSQWSDGSVITAEDFVYSWNRVLDPKNGAPYASLLYPIAGAENYHQGRETDFTKVGIKALTPTTLQVQLHSPCPYFLDLCSFVTLYPTPKHLIEQHGKAWANPENIMGNGPFTIEEWKRRQHFIFKPNPQYHDIHNLHLERLEAKLVDDHDTAYKLFLKSQLDWINTIPLSKQQEAIWNKSYYAMPYMGTYFYRFNVKRPPFDDPKVRRAFSLAVDRKVITQQILKGGEQYAGFFCPPVSTYQPIEGIQLDVEQAQRLMNEAGYKDRRRFPKVELYFNTSENHKKIAEAITKQWEEHLGVRVGLKNTEWKVFLNEMSQLNYDICRSSWIGDYGDPNTFFELFRSDSGNNRTGYQNPEYDSLLHRASLEQNSSKRMDLFRKMEEKIVIDDCILLPIYIYLNKGLLHPKVQGWYPNIRDIHPLKHLWIKK